MLVAINEKTSVSDGRPHMHLNSAATLQPVSSQRYQIADGFDENAVTFAGNDDCGLVKSENVAPRS
jgi:hypothetical protein